MPQLSEQKNSSITLSPASEGLVVSLDYASTVLISFAAGQMQVRRCFSTTMMKSTLTPGKTWPNPSHSFSLPPNLIGLGQHRLRDELAVHLRQVGNYQCHSHYLKRLKNNPFHPAGSLLASAMESFSLLSIQ